MSSLFSPEVTFWIQGFQIPQEIPEKVWDAFERLKELGYAKHLLSEV